MLHSLRTTLNGRENHNLLGFCSNYVAAEFIDTVNHASKERLLNELRIALWDEGDDRWLTLKEVCEVLFLLNRLEEITPTTDFRYATFKKLEDCMVDGLRSYFERTKDLSL